MHLFGLDVQAFLTDFGIIAAFLVIFAESCLVFFLPGDSFIFAAGILASQGIINVWLLVLLMVLGAVFGNSLGYFLGKVAGERLFKSEKSLLFKPAYVRKSQEFYDRHGAFTIVLARFVPLVRTFAPIVAGIGRMRYVVFVTYNIFGAIVWVASLTLIGYFAGARIPNIDHYVLPIVGVIVALSVIPGLVALVRNRRRR